MQASLLVFLLLSVQGFASARESTYRSRASDAICAVKISMPKRCAAPTKLTLCDRSVAASVGSGTCPDGEMGIATAMACETAFVWHLCRIGGLPRGEWTQSGLGVQRRGNHVVPLQNRPEWTRDRQSHSIRPPGRNLLPSHRIECMAGRCQHYARSHSPSHCAARRHRGRRTVCRQHQRHPEGMCYQGGAILRPRTKRS
jgi:hypothetical protein